MKMFKQADLFNPQAIVFTPIAVAFLTPLFASSSMAQALTPSDNMPQKVAICLPFVGCTPDLPSVPGLPSTEDILKGELYKALAQSLGEEAPIVSSADAIYPTVDQLPGQAFNATQAIANGRRVTLDSNGTVLLGVGDYLVPVDVFCMKHNASSPSAHRYLLAPLKGKFADVIAALNSRSSGSGINHSQLQVLSWNLQAGMKYDDMTPENQAIVDRLIPDHKGKLTKSFLETIEGTYNRLAPLAPGMPSSMNAALDRLGDVGRTFNQVRQVQSQLRQYGNDYSALSRLLTTTDRGNGFQSGGESNTPWSKINDRLYGRLVTENSYNGPAKLQLRVLPKGNQANRASIVVASSTLSSNLFSGAIANTPDSVPFSLTQTVADSQSPSIQPLSMSPQASAPVKKKEDELYTSPYTPIVAWTTLNAQDKVFDSCSAASQELSNVFAAKAQWRLSSAWLLTPEVKLLPNGSYEARARLRYFAAKTDQKVDYPRYIWKVKKEKKSPDEMAWKKAIDALMVHEKGHLDIADDYASTKSLGKTQIIGVGNSEALALAALETNRLQDLATNQQSLQLLSDSYDGVTQHGLTQGKGPAEGFPGGQDVKFQCP